ncbi:hypothetical protein U9M48_005141 [Paspalum notatum var. saurae]|uniref:Replication protein A 70 kDa DNA-binding subunit B/D first OB fold domain-containing protein n=1 Tax=Paspalum notatum var. saurae TaxID=547442 RepID=A0AAQ3PL79_PASNO
MKRRSLASSDETPQPRTLRRNAAAPSDETPQQHHRPSISAEERTVGRKANITPVSDLRPGRIDYTIHVRISRMWEFRGPNEENDLRHLDLILIDQKGDPIYAEIPPDAVPDLKSFLEEGKIIIMSKITVERAKPGYRAVENPYMIKLNTRTCIFPCAETINFPKYTFSLTPFEILPQYIRRTDRFLAKVYNTSGDPMMRRVIRLQDLLMGNVIELSLSGKRATEFPAEAVLDVGQKHHVIAIFVGTLMKLYRDEHRFLSGTSACRWYINENDIPAIKTFQKSLPNEATAVENIYLQSDDEMQQNFEQANLLQLQKVDPFIHKGLRYQCTVTIVVLMIKQRFGKQPIIPVFRPEITIAPDSESTTISHEKDLPALIAIPSKKSNAQTSTSTNHLASFEDMDIEPSGYDNTITRILDESQSSTKRNLEETDNDNQHNIGYDNDGDQQKKIKKLRTQASAKH